MTPIEIMALIVIVISVIKIIIMLTNPMKWMGVVNAVWKNKGVATIVSLIGAGIALYYLLGAGITVVQIFAVLLLLMFLMGLSMAAYSDELLAMATKVLKNKGVVKKGWLAFIVWAVLLLWGLKELFMAA